MFLGKQHELPGTEATAGSKLFWESRMAPAFLGVLIIPTRLDIVWLVPYLPRLDRRRVR